jgi:hypothetical protein
MDESAQFFKEAIIEFTSVVLLLIAAVKLILHELLTK